MALFAGLAVAGALAAVSRPESSPLYYVAVGDSLTAGIGAFYGFGFADYLARFLRRSGRTVRYANLGRIRITSSGLKERLQDDPDLRSAVSRADILTVCIGGNDLLQCRQDPSCLERVVAAFPRNWRDILNGLRELNPDATVVALALYNPYPVGDPRREQAEFFIERVNAAIRDPDLVRQYRIRVAEMRRATDGRERLRTWVLFGDIHPNGLGYRAVAEEIARCVASREAGAANPDARPPDLHSG